MTTPDAHPEQQVAGKHADRAGMWMMGIVCGGLVALLLGLAAFYASREIAFRRIAVETEGQVVSLAESRSRNSDGRWSVSYYPVFRYTLPDGTVMERQAGVGGNPPHYAVGDVVRVRYDPSQPAYARISSFLQSWFLPVLLATIGTLIGLAGLLIGRRLARPAVRQTVPAPLPNLAVTATLAGLRREETAEGPRWIVQARWRAHADAKPILFESAPLPFDPTPQMGGMTTVQVWIGSGTPNGRDAMDLSFLRVPEAVADAGASPGPARHG